MKSANSPLALQAKLLRVLQEHEFERVGGTRPIQGGRAADRRHQPEPRHAIKNNQFRQDLFYRLNVVSLTMPPLRERREDISGAGQPLHPEVQPQGVHAPGSRHFVEGGAAVGELSLAGKYPRARKRDRTGRRAGMNDLIMPEDLPEALLEVAPGTIPLDEYHAGVNEARRQIVLRALEKTKGNMTQAAHLLGIQPTYLHRLVRNLDLKERIKGAEEVQ